MKMLKKTWAGLEYETNPDFRILMDDLNDSYRQLLAQAQRMNLSQLHSMRLVQCIGRDPKGYPVFCVYGMFFPIGKELLRSLYLYFLWAMEQMLQQVELRYHLVFFNSVCCDYKNFLKFKQMFKTLPLKFYTKLESIVIVHPNFAIRALQWLSFGTLNSMLSKYVVLAHNLQQLLLMGVLTQQTVSRLPKQIISSEASSQQEPLATDEIQQLRRHISQKNEVIGCDFDQYELSEIGVPTLLKMLLAYFIVRPDKLLEEGLFRKNANSELLEELEMECRCKNYEFIGKCEDPHVICGLIKKIFYHSKLPLFSYDTYDRIIRENNIEAIQFLEFTVQQMPALNHRILQFLIEFLKYKVAVKEQQNKMNCYSLAVIFAPCLFRPKEYKINDLVYSGKIVKVMQAILCNFERLFGDYEHQSQVYRRSSDEQNEESRRTLGAGILKRYDPVSDKHRKSIPMSEILRFD